METKIRLFVENKNFLIKDQFYDKKFLQFIKKFYSQSYHRDFTSYSVDDLFNLAYSNFNLLIKKKHNFEVSIDNYIRYKEYNITILNIINDDKPFLLDSVIMHLDNSNIEIQNIVHPIVSIKRDSNNDLKEILDLGDGNNESIIQLHIQHISSLEERKAIKKDIVKILDSVSLAVNDWKTMSGKVLECKNNIREYANDNLDDKEEICYFLEWLSNNNFTFLGVAEYEIVDSKFVILENSRLGVYCSKYPDVRPFYMKISSYEVNDIINENYLIEILKSRYRSNIHRLTNVDRIRVQKFNSSGSVVGEYRILGLFTSSVYYQSANLIPIIRKKIEYITENSRFEKGSHNLKDLLSVLDSYPRDELFQIEKEDLHRIALAIVAISGRSIVRFFARNDKFNRFVSCLIFIPKDCFNTDLKNKIYDSLSEIYHGNISDSYAQITDSNLTRLHLIINLSNNCPPKVTESEIEKKLIQISKSWNRFLKEEVEKNFSTNSQKIFSIYKDSFSLSYKNRFRAKSAVSDIDKIEEAINTKKIVCDIYHSSLIKDNKNITELKIYSLDKELYLSDIMPVLDSFGFNVIHEHTYLVNLESLNKKIWIHYFNLNIESKIIDDSSKSSFKEVIVKTIGQEIPISYLNSLIISANLNYRQVLILKCYLAYLYQIGFFHEEKYVSKVLVKYSSIITYIIDLFEYKFDPEIKKNNSVIEKKSNKIITIIKEISNNIEDQIIRRFFNLAISTVRTNFYQKKKNKFKDYYSFKFSSKKVQDIPLPVPYAEIFVYSTNVEAIHLRGGKVSRGGIRWSDRHKDFRTEVLGLMKAQMAKNSVIVPVGSKGGFVIKQNLDNLSKEEIFEIAKKNYVVFLSGLLDITDNIINNKLHPPKDVVRYDDNDPYLVVAADKGTASFSDIANQVSKEYNFWLGDAFASGGSEGYDHKTMGITARGAFISVRRHFLEMNKDIEKEEFTSVAIGDMSGDVFGNGMLLSDKILLVAAFNHLHIFIDPDPNSKTSYKERKRLFKLKRSTWLDYNRELISKGGGVFSRNEKTIKISPEVGKLLDIEEKEVNPNYLISKILKSEVDLIWNGGIGTYVKASSESNMEVGDKANDSVRINGIDVKAKIFGEGGNLGLTQKGRIEYAMSGGRLNTDAIDNSSGVACSDREVNIKIALIKAMESNNLSFTERNDMLEKMTEEVADLVLRENKMQNQVITMSYFKGYVNLEEQRKFLNILEKLNILDRKLEFLPTNKEITRRQSDKQKMTRPELSIMLAYSKMDIYSQIVNSKLVTDPYFEETLFNYFPNIMHDKLRRYIQNHELKSEIIATEITNDIVNRTGISFVRRISEDNGVSITDIIKNYIIVCQCFELKNLWEEIEKLDGKIPFNLQIDMFLNINKFLERTIIWLLRNNQIGNIKTVIKRFKGKILKLSDNILNLLAIASRKSYSEKVQAYSGFNIKKSLVSKISSINPLASAYDIINIANNFNLRVEEVAKIYFEVGSRLSLKLLREKVNEIEIENYWNKLSLKIIMESIYHYQTSITKKVVHFGVQNDYKIEEFLEKWIKNFSHIVTKYDRFIIEFNSNPNINISMMVVVLNRIKALAF